MYGHTARIWKVRAFGNSNLVTASEDTSVRIWCVKSSLELRLMQGMCPLAGKNVRGLATFNNLIASGAEDSSVRLFSPQLNIEETQVK
jgi:WD40 repeat protein